MRLNNIDIDFAIDTLGRPTYGKVSEIERAMEIAIKALRICKEMLGQTESYEIVKKQDVIDLCYMLQDKSSKQGQVLIEQIISAVEDIKPE